MSPATYNFQEMIKQFKYSVEDNFTLFFFSIKWIKNYNIQRIK